MEPLIQSRYRRYPELWVLLFAALLCWPVNQVLARHVPAVGAIFGFCAFLLPGAALVCIVGDEGYWWERLALAFVASLAVPGLMSEAAVFLHTDIAVVLHGFLVITGVLVIAAVARCLITPKNRENAQFLESAKDRPSVWLWTMLVVMLIAVVVYQRSSPLTSDHTDALSYIQNMRYDGHMMAVESKYEAGLPRSPRFDFSAWLVDQALVSRLADIDPWDQFEVVRLAAMLLALAAFFRLARRISRRRDAAVLITILWMVYLITSNSHSVPGYEVIVRSDLDKVVAGFVILPVALSVVLDIFDRRESRYWVWLILCSIAAGLTHPIAVILMGLSLAWFAVAELVAEQRWATLARLSLVAVILIFAAAPPAFSLVRGYYDPGASASTSMLSDTRDPTLASQLSYTLDYERIWILDSGKYILHPRFIWQAVVIPALLGLPFLFWLQRRSRGARLLFGMIAFVSFAVLFPPLAGVVGRFTTPWLFYRTNWPISMAAVVALGWASWGLIGRIPRVRIRNVVLVMVWVALLGVTFPAARASLMELYTLKNDATENLCVQAEPLLRSFRELAPEPTMVLAEPDINLCLVARAPYVGVLEWRGADVVAHYAGVGREDEGWERLFAAEYFDSAESVDGHLLEIVDQWHIKYLVVRLDSPLEPQLHHLPGMFRPVVTGSGRRVYQVVSVDALDPIVQANSHLAAGQPREAIAAFHSTLSGDVVDGDRQYLGRAGLGRAYMQIGDLKQALAAWQLAGRTAQEAEAFAWQGDIYALQGARDEALASYQQAVGLQPDHSGYQRRLGDMRQAVGDLAGAEGAYAASAQSRALPGHVPYYVEVGSSWQNVGEAERAATAFQKAAGIYGSQAAYQLVAQAYQAARQWDDARAVYESMIRRDRWAAKPRAGLAQVYRDADEVEKATGEYEQALRLNPLCPGAYQALSDLWKQAYGAPDALERVKATVGYARLGTAEAHLAAAGLDSSMGLYDQALGEAEQALLWNRLASETYRSVAGSYLDLGQVEDAVAAYRQSLRISAQYPSAYLGLAQIALKRGDPEQALGYDLTAARVAPYQIWPRQAVAGEYELLGQDALTLHHLESARVLAPTSESPLLWLGDYYRRRGDPARAEAVLQQAEELNPSISVLYNQGLLAQSRGDLHLATEYLRRATALAPGYGYLRVRLGSILEQAGDRPGAVKQYLASTQVDPGFAAGFVSLGAAYETGAQWDLAEQTYWLAVRALPFSAEGYIRLGRLAARKGQEDEALSFFRQAAEVRPSAPEAQTALGDFWSQQGDFDAAVAAYRAAISLAPATVDNYLVLGTLLHKSGNRQAAIDLYQTGLEINLTSGRLLAGIGDLYAAQGEDSEAEAYFKQAIEAEPSQAAGYLSLAGLYRRQGRFEAVAEVYRQAIGHDQAASYLRVVMADYLRSRNLDGGEDGSMVYYQRAIALAPGSAGAYVGLGDAYRGWGQFGEALTRYHQAAALERGNPQPHIGLGITYQEQGRFAEAETEFRNAIELDQTLSTPSSRLGELYLQEGRDEEALMALRTAAERAPLEPYPAVALGRALQQSGQMEGALQVLQAAVRTLPLSGYAHNALAGLLLTANRDEEAKAEWVAATERDPSYAEGWVGLAGFYAARGEFKQAEVSCRAAVAADRSDPAGYVNLGHFFKATGKLTGGSGSGVEDPADDSTTKTTGACNAGLACEDRLVDGMAAYRAAVGAAPASAWPRYVLGQAYGQLGRVEEAEATYRQAMAVDPGFVWSYVALCGLLRTQGRFDAAEAACQAALVANPADPDGATALGRFYQARGLPDQARAQFERAASLAPAAAGPYLAMGDVMRSLARWDEARAAYERAIELEPGNVDGYVRLGDGLRGLGQFQESETVLKHATEVDAGASGPWVSLARLYRIQGDFDLSLKAAEAALQRGQDQAGGYLCSAETHQSLGENDQALADLELGIDRVGGDPVLYLAIGDLHRDLGRVADAEEAYQAAVALDRSSPTGLLALGDLYQQQNRYREAEESLLEATRIAPGVGWAHTELAAFYHLEGRYEEAQAELEIAIDRDPTSSSAYQALANLFLLLADGPSAEATFLAGQAASPADPWNFIGLAGTYQNRGRLENAERQYRAAVKASPGSAWAALSLGKFYQSQGDVIQATAAYTRAQALEPTLSGPHAALANLYWAQGAEEEAESSARKATALHPGDVQAWNGLAGFFLSRNQLPGALSAYQAATVLSPGQPDAYAGLCRTYRSQGDAQAALAACQQAIAAQPGDPAGQVALGDLYRLLKKDVAGGGKGVPSAAQLAESAYRQAIALDANEQSAYVGLGQLYRQQGAWAQAEALYLGLLAETPGATWAQLALGDLYRAHEDWDLALATYQRALAWEPGNLRALVGLGFTYEALGDLKQARDAFAEAALLWPTDQPAQVNWQRLEAETAP